jgi:hypothetical protein
LPFDGWNLSFGNERKGKIKRIDLKYFISIWFGVDYSKLNKIIQILMNN